MKNFHELAQQSYSQLIQNELLEKIKKNDKIVQNILKWIYRNNEQKK